MVRGYPNHITSSLISCFKLVEAAVNVIQEVAGKLYTGPRNVP